MHDIISIYADSPETDGLTDKQLKIFKSAIELFAKNGYANSSTKEIATNAGVSEGSIFKKFKNKEDLLFSILNPFLRNILPKVVNEFTEETLQTNYDTLTDFVSSILKNRNMFFKENVNALKIFVDEFVYDLKIRDKMIKAIPYQYMKSFNDQVNSFKKRKMIVDWTNSEIFRFIFATLFGYLAEHYFIFESLKWDEDLEMDHTIEFVVKGLQP
ncbi:TetR/AcrR family transcriptional regulator [Companilactobacillus mishanensis]|uniref:TetR/AcrR family transcriptional regulator n=1 Tax=Companilactobacillus mishanensis TaxID=2486008 RepID=UPI000F7B9285|nr:TetR/AcrR family transcriptional regulator [Companilactobacillus mishanensis]